MIKSDVGRIRDAIGHTVVMCERSCVLIFLSNAARPIGMPHDCPDDGVDITYGLKSRLSGMYYHSIDNIYHVDGSVSALV